MSHWIQQTITVTVPAGGAAHRVWANPHSTPVKNYSIMTTGTIPDASKLSAEVFLGGYFTDASGNQVPAYTDDATIHVGGTSQAAAAPIAASGTDLTKAIYENSGVLPANSVSMNYPISPNSVPVVVEFKNTNTAPVEFRLTFYGEALGSTV